MGDWYFDEALRVEIVDDYEMVAAFFQWLIAAKDLENFRGGHSGRGNYLGWFKLEDKGRIQVFFEDWDEEH